MRVSLRTRLVAILGSAALSLIGAAGSFAAPSGMHLQTTDIVQVVRSASGCHAEFTRRIGVGMDSPRKSTFDATVVDVLPAGYRLLSPKPGTVNVRALDGKRHPIVVASKKKGDSTELRFEFRDLPSLPKGEECCECSGECGRACSIDFSYKTSFPGNFKEWGSLECLPSGRVPVGKTGSTQIKVNVRDLALQGAAVVLKIPREVNGARLTVKGHSKALRASGSVPGSARLIGTLKPGDTSLTVELAVDAMRTGTIGIPGFAEVTGITAKPLRRAPSFLGASKAPNTQQCHVGLKSGLEIQVR